MLPAVVKLSSGVIQGSVIGPLFYVHVVSRILYALPAWKGFHTSERIAQIDVAVFLAN